MPKISVIIPVYNVEQYLRKCLDSVCNQTLKDIEIICVNDCSTDNSLSILKEYAQKDKRFIVKNFETKQNAAVARNEGMKKAQGEYFSFIDSDDFIDLDFYEKLYGVASKNNADISKGNSKVFYLDGKVDISGYNRLIPQNKMSFLGCWWSAIYKRDFLKSNNILFPEECPKAQDIVFLNRCLLATNKIVLYNDTYYNYIRHENSLDSDMLCEAKLRSALTAFGLILVELNKNRDKLSDLEYLYAYAMRLGGILELFYKTEDYSLRWVVLQNMSNFYNLCMEKESLFEIGNFALLQNELQSGQLNAIYNILLNYKNATEFSKKSLLLKMQKNVIAKRKANA